MMAGSMRGYSERPLLLQRLAKPPSCGCDSNNTQRRRLRQVWAKGRRSLQCQLNVAAAGISCGVRRAASAAQHL